MTDTLAASLQKALGSGFRLDRELGGGGMSRVFVARDLSLGRDIVVKVLSAESTSGLSGDRFRREIQVIAQLQHPHIVSILSAGEADGALYYSMPFVKGESLRERITREGRLSIADTVTMLRELLDALAFAHGHGVVHRDIKPENILLEAGHVLVADFGIAKALRESGNLTSAGIALGTPAYMAPEQATADPTTDHRADLYAVGVLGYELLTGAPPFTGSAQQVITGHITTPAPSVQAHRPDAPDALVQLVARALEKEPSARPSTATEMIAAVNAAAAANGATAVSASPSAAAAIPPRRRSRAVLTAVGVIVAVAAAGTLLRSGTNASAPVVEDGAELIAVMPLGAVSDTSLTRLGQDLVVTLSANLDGVGSLRSVDAATLLMKARDLPSPIPIADAQRLGRELSAGSVMTGTLLAEGNQVRASVVLHKVGSDSVLAKATALAPPGNIAALTDSLSWSVLRQVWKQGTAPSPVLTGITTQSVDALRAFLDGERKFQRLEWGAPDDYRRAFELDPDFAHAYLRYEYVNEWFGAPRDTMVHRRLLALVDRLPERERLWVETREHELPAPEAVEEWKALMARYPDYPPFVMAAADPIIHAGPIHGLPMREVLPLLERLVRLAPDHFDTRLHDVVVRTIIGTREEAADAMRDMADAASGGMAGPMKFQAELFGAHAAGRALPPPERAAEVRRVFGLGWNGSYLFSVQAGYPVNYTSLVQYQQQVNARVRRDGILTGEAATAMAFGESGLAAQRGAWTSAVDIARQLEGTLLAPDIRLSSARLAALGAWLEAIDPQAADLVVRRVRAAEEVRVSGVDRAELLWTDGMMGVVLGDSARTWAAMDALGREATLEGRHTVRSLAGLWLNRTDPAAAGDSLRAVSDDVMRTGGYLLAAEALGRLVVARALRARGEDAAVERYLMWPDAWQTSARSIGALATAPITNYERASAFEATGNVVEAVKYYRRFVENYDQPPEAHRDMVRIARARLQALEAKDAGKATVVPPGK